MKPLNAASAALAAAEFARLRQGTTPDDHWKAYRWVHHCQQLDSGPLGLPIGATHRDVMLASARHSAAVLRARAKQDVELHLSVEVGGERLLLGYEDAFLSYRSTTRSALSGDDFLPREFSPERCAAVGPEAVREHRAWLEAALQAGHVPALVAALQHQWLPAQRTGAGAQDIERDRVSRDRLIGLAEAAALRGEPAPLGAALKKLNVFASEEGWVLDRQQLTTLLQRLLPVYGQSLSLKAGQSRPDLLDRPWSVRAAISPVRGIDDEFSKVYAPCEHGWSGTLGENSIATRPWTGQGCGWLLRGEPPQSFDQIIRPFARPR